MDRPTRGRKMSFAGLKLAFDRMDHGDGRQGRAGNWEILLGGYDMGYEIYYQGKPIGRVNYELSEYELYLDDLISRSELPMFLDAIDATGFKNVHDHGDEETCLESKRTKTMKKLNITKEAFEKSQYFKNKYGKLEYVSESGKLFKTNKGKVLMFKEDVHQHETDANVPVTEQEKLLCQYIQDEIEGELNEETGLDLTCGCNWHNPGEEQHIEIYVGIPEDDDPSDPKYDNIETFLEQFVNKIGDAENEGEKWGDASFQWISDEEIFGELWPLGGEVKESTKKFGKKIAKESFDDMEKEFTYKGVTITRYDYESLPSPMAASKLDDKTMQNIATDIYDYLSSAGWEDDEIAKYLGSNLDEVLDDDWKGEQIKDEFWQYMEKAALDNGMEYYEDMPEDEM